MALGRSSLETLSEHNRKIYNICSEQLKDQWNTFQYVTNNLEAWADETTVGNELREELRDYVSRLRSAIDGTKELTETINRFIADQEQTNNERRY